MARLLISPFDFKLLALFLILTFKVCRAVEFVSVPTSVEAGKTYTITWSPTSDKVSLILRQGDPNNLNTLQTITTTATGGSFQWTVPTSLPSRNDYALEIKPATGPSNFSGQIKLTGSTASESSTSTTSTQITTSTTSSKSTSSQSQTTTSTTSTSTDQTSTDQTSTPTSTPHDQTSSSTSSADSTGSSSAQRTSSTKSPTPAQATTSGASAEASTPANTSPSEPNSNTNGQTGLSTGVKAGIGVGVSFAGLAMAFGAFFLGMSVRKKKKDAQDIEAPIGAGKTELDGKETHGGIPPELSGNSTAGAQPSNSDGKVVAEKPEELDARNVGELPVVIANKEMEGSSPPAPLERTELSSEPPLAEMDSRSAGSAPQELPTDEVPRAELGAAVGAETPPAPARRNTYDDPQLVQNPWAQDESEIQSR